MSASSDENEIACIILCGGKGTRLRSIVTGRPKCMALINGIPFLEVLMSKFYSSRSVGKFVLACGYKYKEIINHFDSDFRGIPIVYEVDAACRGTLVPVRDSILNNCEFDQMVFVCNGDTMFDIDLSEVVKQYTNSQTPVILVRSMSSAVASGTIFKKNGRRFSSLAGSDCQTLPDTVYASLGLIFGSVKEVLGLVDVGRMDENIEDQVIPSAVDRGDLLPIIFDGKFIDIGTPGYYAEAQLSNIHTW